MDNNINPTTGSKGTFFGGSQNVDDRPDNGYGGISSDKSIDQNQPQNHSSKIFSKQELGNEQKKNDVQTFFVLNTFDSEKNIIGSLEIDLISFREKGQESRYLSFFSSGVGKEGEKSETTLSMDSEAEFIKFKRFVSELNWND